jgi:hypothetical protein
MATNFPNSLDNLTNPASTDPIDNPSHSQQHTNANDAIEALEAKVGVNGSANTTSLDYRVSQLEVNPTYTNEMAQDAVATAFAGGDQSSVTVNYDDLNNTFSLTVNAVEAAQYTQTVKHTVRAGVALSKGQAVYVTGSNGTNMLVGPASNAAESTSSKTFGLTQQALSVNQSGFVITEGLLAGLNTATAQQGDPVWLGTDGGLIYGLDNKPHAPAHLVFIGIVTRVNSNNGEIFVKVQNGFELDELHDVYINGKQNNQVLRYNSTTGLWTNQTIDNLFDPAGSAATVQTNLTNHDSDTTNIHGIADTSLLATKTYADNAASAAAAAIVDSAPGTLDTLNELAAAINDDASYAATITTALGTKAPLASPALTGTPTAPTATVGTDSTQIATTAFVIDQIDASTQPGALYQTTAPTSPEVGQIWIDSDDEVDVFDQNIIRRQAFTAVAEQDTFTTDVQFIPGYEQVFMNGILLMRGTDYTTPTEHTVVLAADATAGDIIDVLTVTNLNSVDTYTQAETDAFINNTYTKAQVDALLAANTSVAPLSISANTTLVAKKRYFVTSSSALTLTLPASPVLNDEIQLVDASGNASTYNITVARNGNKINGGTGNLIIDNNGGWYTLLYTGTTYGWKVG